MPSDKKAIDDSALRAGTHSSLRPAIVAKANESSNMTSNKTDNSTCVVKLPAKIGLGGSKYNSSQSDLTYAYAERFAFRFVVFLTLIWLVGVIMNISRLVWLGLLSCSELKNRTIVDSSLLGDVRPIDSKVANPSKVSMSSNIDGPIGLPNGEIVVTPWFLDSLTVEQRQAVYAHEHAHQIRRDPLWLIYLHLLNAVVWIQPLHKLARRKLVLLAELQADAWAARKVSTPRVLAESLLVCAERVVVNPKMSFGSSFSSKGFLIQRIDCLLDGTAMKQPRRPYLVHAAVATVLTFALFLLPGCNVDSDLAYRNGQKISVTKQEDGKKGEATIRRANLLVKLTRVGSLKLTDGNDDVELLEKGGSFQLAESVERTKRIYSIKADESGNMTRTFSRDGKATVIDEDVKGWFAEALERTVRESGF
jgi:beta-lactamase regulating signal transducer with metallopeptidase domain